MIEWHIPFLLTTPYGTLPFNEAITSDGIYYLLDKTKCQMGPRPLRADADNVPQGHGSILHREFKPGYVVQIGLEYWETKEKIACDDIAREMHDLLMAHLDSLINPADSVVNTGQARLQWTPTGYPDDRLVDRAQLLDWPTIGYADDGGIQIGFSLHSPLPYALDLTQRDDTIADTPGSTTLTNLGNTEMWPVFKVHGPVNSFVINNETSDLHIVYDDTLPGAAAIAGGDYVEIACFSNTMYLNGNEANMKPGLDVTASDFFSILPGANVLSYDGTGSCEILWNYAWVS